jgi:hypothetical protein
MRHGIEILTVTALLLGSAAIGAQTTSEPLSGLPLAPGFERTGDPVQSYKFCGKSASIALYVGAGFADLDQENAWFAHALPHAAVFTASTGIRTFITPDGTAAVEAPATPGRSSLQARDTARPSP